MTPQRFLLELMEAKRFESSERSVGLDLKDVSIAGVTPDPAAEGEETAEEEEDVEVDVVTDLPARTVV